MSIIPIIPSVKVAFGDLRSVLKSKYLKRREKFDSICLDNWKYQQQNRFLEARKEKLAREQSEKLSLVIQQLTEALAKIEGLEMQLRFADPTHPLEMSNIISSLEKEESLGGENLPGLKRAKDLIISAIQRK